MFTLTFITNVLVQLVLVAAQGIITSDTYFYGESPLVPPVAGTGAGNWSAAYAKAKAFVAQLSLDEKVNFTAGYTLDNGCSGGIPPLTRLGFPGMCLQDSGNSVRGTDFVNGWPSGLHVGASWNKELAYARGYGIGGEFRTKGVNVLLGPVISPLGRMAEGGRNWEGFSNDPYLCGALVGPTVAAMQSNGVITSTKHFIAYEQETNRNPNANNTVQSVSSNLDDQTMHELYLWPFQEAVLAGSGNIMCSYNRINNSYASQNSKTLNGILKTELGFQGFVVSDWYAQHTGVASAISGLDMAMPDSTYWGGNLSEAVTNGSVPAWRLDDMVTRIMAAWYQMGQDSPDYPAPGIGMPEDLLAPHPIVNARNPASKPALLQGAIEGHVLVKNVNNALPLKKPELLGLYGYDAIVPGTYGPMYEGWSTGAEGINPEILFCEFEVGSGCGTVPQYVTNTMWSGGGSGATTPQYISAPFDAILEYSIKNDINLFWDFVDTNSTTGVDGATDACLVFINAFATEGFDRTGLHDDYSDGLVENVTSQCSNTIVVIHNAGIRLVDQWIENPNVTAVIIAHLPGQDSGRALVEILFGMTSPSGKLPYTLAKNESDYGPLLAPSLPEGAFVDFPQSNFTEGLFIDYKRFDQLNIEPRYEFGFGLTYTTFAYSGLQTQVLQPQAAQYPTGEIVPGGPTDLWDIVAKVSAQVQNTGSMAAAEIAQLYVGLPGDQPVRQLRGFEKVMVQPGQTVTVEFELRRKDLSVWDTVAQQWSLQNGDYGVWVGASSRNLPLTGALSF